ncbi:MAG: 3-hydroxybutyryl-CoA dehydrogenase, partial [Alphaproteobacteria bacterium]|nr:3-hydroxybutyryl-CoA dehydrogenase [Alphaproteobacteria bacterium]
MIKTIGVIGAGQMGGGIAHVAALAGLDVRLCDVSDDQLKKAVTAIDRNIDRQVQRGKTSAVDKTAAMSRIKTGVDFALLGDCDVVIEAATENEAVK